MARILLIEDEPELRNVLQSALVGDNHEVKTAEGREGLRLLLLTAFDLVITDLCVPGYQGMEILSDLHERVPLLPVVVMSGRILGDHELEEAQALAKAVLSKPFSVAELLKTVYQVLRLG